jgi:ABC-type transport system involved in multi-copper enzyme maturation permease subunit
VSRSRDVSRPVPFGRAARAVFDLALEGMLWSRKSVVMAVLLGLPVVFGILYRVVLVAKLPAQITAAALFGETVVGYYIGNVLPLVALFYAAALVAEEVDGKTITYLLTRPITRTSILTGKFAAYVATTLALTLPSTLVTFFLVFGTSAGSSVPDLFRDLGALSLTLVAYGALFTLLGVLVRRPLIPGLLFVFVWEWVSKAPGYLPRLTLTAYLRSLVSYRPAEEGIGGFLLGQVQPVGLSLAMLLSMSALFLWLAFWIFSAREYVIEQ